MALDMNIILWIIALAIFVGGLFMVIVGFQKSTFQKKGGKKFWTVFFGFLFIGLALFLVSGTDQLSEVTGLSFLSVTTPSGQLTVATGTGAGAVVGTSVTTFQPTAAYSAVDKFSATTAIAGTQYYQLNDGKYTTTAQTNVIEGKSISYWVDNATYYIKPALIPRAAGEVNLVEVEGYNNASATITLYDQVGRAATTDGASNISMGANAQANIEVSYQGTAKKSAGPFGGVVVAEYNSSIPSVTCTGALLLNSNPYHVTYTIANLGSTFKMWAYGPGMDDGTGNVNKFNCQFLNGATAIVGGANLDTFYKFAFIPADYYVTDAGDIALDTEKFLNQDTSRTAGNSPTATGFWSA